MSADPLYNGFDPSDVNVTNLGTTVAGFTVTPTTGLQTSQAGATATFTVALTSIPQANVSFSLSSSNTSAGTVSPTALTFTPANWNVPQTVTVTGASPVVDVQSTQNQAVLNRDLLNALPAARTMQVGAGLVPASVFTARAS